MSFNFSEHDDKLLFVPLGGSNEIGMNLNLYRYKGKWLMIDLGIGFADDYLPGVEIVLPDLETILPYVEDIVGLVLTHAHEDHLGAVGYLWEELRCPVYATAFTAAMLKPKLAEEKLTGTVKVHEVKAGQQYELGPFTLDMIPLTHSIPEMHAIAIRTDKGVIMHTGDWKLDSDPMVGPTSDEETLSRYGDEGVLAMVCDSTNVFVEGESGSESGVRENLKNTINSCKQRVLVTTFASNIARLESIIYAGLDAGRSIALAGKSLWRVTSAAQESGYLQDIPPFLSDREAMDLPRDKVLILATGGQGEPRAALTKIARQEHPGIRLQPEDTVVFSSRVIPGNETKVGWLHNKLVNMGIEVITDHQAGIHVSGHPCREELERMYQLVRPHISVPVHGEARHIHEHAKLAKQLQVPYAVEATNGAVIQLEEHEAKIIGMVDSGYIAMDGITMMDTDSSIIRTRRKIRDQGCVVVSLLVDKQGKVVSLPKLSAPGCMDSDDDAALIRTICEDVMGVVNSHKSRKSDRLGDVIRAAIRRHLNRELGKKPVIDIHIHELKR